MTTEELGCRLKPVFLEKRAIKAILFGSRARGTDDARSDVDLIIVDDDERPYLERLDKYFKDITTRIDAALDLFVYTSAEAEAMKDKPFLSRALAEGVVLYER
jgi:uncharacterized protein